MTTKSEVLSKARETFATAKRGLDDLVGKDQPENPVGCTTSPCSAAPLHWFLRTSGVRTGTRSKLGTHPTRSR
jgi:hypothetical protein